MRAQAFAWCLLGEALLLDARWEESEGCLSRSCEVHAMLGSRSGSLPWQRRAELAACRGDYEEVHSYLREASAIATVSSMARHMWGRIYATSALGAIEQGDAEEAVRFVQAAAGRGGALRRLPDLQRVAQSGGGGGVCHARRRIVGAGLRRRGGRRRHDVRELGVAGDGRLGGRQRGACGRRQRNRAEELRGGAGEVRGRRPAVLDRAIRTPRRVDVSHNEFGRERPGNAPLVPSAPASEPHERNADDRADNDWHVLGRRSQGSGVRAQRGTRRRRNPHFVLIRVRVCRRMLW